MISKKLSVVALSGLTAALSLSAVAQDTTSSTSSSTTSSSTTGGMSGSMGTGTMSGDMSSTGTMSGSGMMSGEMSAPMSMQPMMVTGSVLRYYTDRAGFVTAADVQTAEGTRMVRFAPSMAQRLYSTYPVGGQFSGMIQPSMSMGMARYDVVSLGESMPAAGMMQPSMVSDVEMLKSEPFINAGSKMIQFSGKLQSTVTDDSGEILALVLQNVKGADVMGMMGGSMMPGGMMSTGMSGSMDTSMSGGSSSAMGGSMGTSGSMGTGTDSSGGMMTGTMDSSSGGTMAGGSMSGGSMSGGMMGGMMMMGGPNTILVRVPRELRQAGSRAGSDRVAPLFKGSDVEVVGYMEAPRYGVVSNYGQRVAASALVVNGRAVGAVGLPRMMMAKGKKGMASSMGFMTYSPDGAMSSDASTSMSGDMSGGMSGGTGTGMTSGTGTDPSMTTGTTGATGGGAAGGGTTGSTTPGSGS